MIYGYAAQPSVYEGQTFELIHLSSKSTFTAPTASTGKHSG